MKPLISLFVVLVGCLSLVSCTPQSLPSSTPADSTPTLIMPAVSPPPSTGHPPPPTFEGEKLPSVRGELFVNSGVCAICHTRLTDSAGIDVSMDTHWRTSLMANSARDPYWQASVRRETVFSPKLQALIEDTCSSCHMPMAQTTTVAAGGQGVVLDEGYLNPDNPLHDLAMDGVSCSLCHQIEADQLGESSTFDGHFIVDTHAPMGQRPAYGPFVVSSEDSRVMKQTSGLVPTQGTHMQESALCASCHTLYTPFVDSNGNAAGEFPEQMPYLEWEASRFVKEQTCQACHMPAAEGGAELSVTGGPVRQPISIHSFLGGGNTVMSELRVGGDSMGVTASSAQFDDKLSQASQQMQHSAATVEIQDASLRNGTLFAKATVKVLTGHKFPTAFPSRRVWLHVTLADSAGQTVFESGAFDADGRILDNANDLDALSFEPHYTTLTSPDQVQIYEDIMVDTDGQVTTTLLRAAEYVKDNRLLPEGFEKIGANPDIAVAGEALEDSDFTAGGDTLQLAINTGSATGPFTLHVELLYQSVGYRWAENVSNIQAPENESFGSLYELAGNLPVLVSSAEIEVR